MYVWKMRRERCRLVMKLVQCFVRSVVSLTNQSSAVYVQKAKFIPTSRPMEEGPSSNATYEEPRRIPIAL
jgi:hypothetical protein